VTTTTGRQSQRPREAVGFARKHSKALHGVKSVGSFLPGLTRNAFQKFGFSTATLVTDWPVIAGAELAAYTAPERLKWPRGVERSEDGAQLAGKGRSGATLVLRVDGARALEVQYKSRQVLERINAYFGYAAVAEQRILQAPVEGRLPVARWPGSVPASGRAAEFCPCPRPARRFALFGAEPMLSARGWTTRRGPGARCLTPQRTRTEPP
jgi:hypothetical protein